MTNNPERSRRPYVEKLVVVTLFIVLGIPLGASISALEPPVALIVLLCYIFGGLPAILLLLLRK